MVVAQCGEAGYHRSGRVQSVRPRSPRRRPKRTRPGGMVTDRPLPLRPEANWRARDRSSRVDPCKCPPLIARSALADAPTRTSTTHTTPSNPSTEALRTRSVLCTVGSTALAHSKTWLKGSNPIVVLATTSTREMINNPRPIRQSHPRYPRAPDDS
jgi:hypothetical protein